MSRTAYDPQGRFHGGVPTYPFRMAPDGLATRRQLAARGLRPGGQEPVARIVWRKGRRFADLYRVEAALPKRTPSSAVLAALVKAMIPRRTCAECGQVKDYCVSTRTGVCGACMERWGS